jgi:hypothetical protein
MDMFRLLKQTQIVVIHSAQNGTNPFAEDDDDSHLE